MTMPATDPAQELFHEWLAQRPRSCPNCTYALTGLVQPICPECGAGLVLRVSPAEARMRAYLTGLIGISIGLGFSAILFVLMVIFMIFLPHNNDSETWKALIYCGGTAVVLGLVMWQFIRRRRQFRDCSARARAMIAAGAWLASVGSIVIFITTLDLR